MEKIKQIEGLPFIHDFKKMLRKKDYANSTVIAIETATLFRDIIKTKSLWSSFSELLKILRTLGKSLIGVDPLQFSVGNIIKRILYIVRDEFNKYQNSKHDISNDKDSTETKKKRLMRTTSLNSIINYDNLKLAHIQLKNKVNSMTNDDEEADENDELAEYKENILANIDDLISELESISDYIKELAFDHINDNDTILTANHSDQLEEFFIEASKLKSFHVIIAESAPSLNGIVQAKNLNSKGIRTTVIPDSAVYAIMPKVNKVIIGTRAIMANGGLISYNGVYNVCLCAQMYSVPVIVVGGTFKLTPMYPFTHETFNEFISPDKIYKSDYKGDISNIKFNTPAYDYVPSEFITIYLTNHGSQNPAYIYRLFSELYSQEDYFL